MKLYSLIVPCLFLFSFLYAVFKKVKVYDSFTEGIKGAVPLILSIFPYVAAVVMLSKLLETSGLNEKIQNFVSPVFTFVGVPEEILPLLFMKPLSGGGSIAAISEILETYGVDSYIGRCACVAYGASDTIFYIGAVYFAGIKRKKLTAALVISLISFLLAVIFGCFLCRFM